MYCFISALCQECTMDMVVTHEVVWRYKTQPHAITLIRRDTLCPLCLSPEMVPSLRLIMSKHIGGCWSKQTVKICSSTACILWMFPEQSRINYKTLQSLPDFLWLGKPCPSRKEFLFIWSMLLPLQIITIIDYLLYFDSLWSMSVM